MAYVSNNPKFITQTYRPQSSDPSNPTEGMVQYSDGTARAEGLWVYKNGGWYVVGNEAAGLINHISNPDFEVDATGWATYADAAGVAPVDGTGGSPSSTFTRSTSSPLRGVASGLWSKSAANRQGEGFSYALSIDTADQGKVQQISFDYTTTSSYVDGDMRVYIYDVTNATLIEPSQRDLLANSGQATYRGYWQAPSNSTSYRLIVHTSSTSASAYDLKVDNVLVGPIEMGNAGTFASDWQSFTPTGSWSTNTTYSGYYRRVGDSMQVRTRLALAGAPTSATLTVAYVPSGFTIDTAKLTSSSSAGSVPMGYAVVVSAGSVYTANAYYYSSTEVRLATLSNGSGSAHVLTNVTQASPGTFASGDSVEIFFPSIPIQGWSAGVTASEISSNAQVACRAVKTSSQTVTVNPTKVTFTSIASSDSGFDISAAFDTTNSKFIAPESGIYQVRIGAVMANYETAATAQLYIYKNNVSTIRQDVISAGVASTRLNLMNYTFNLVKGDYLELYVGSSDVSYAVVGVTGLNDSQSFFEVNKINSPAFVAPNEVVAASYETNAGLSVSTATVTTVLYEDKILDTHNSYNTSTGEYTIPVSGIYEILAKVYFDSSSAWGTAEAASVRIYIDGTEKSASNIEAITTAGGAVQVNPGTVFYLASLNKGQIVTIRVRQDSGSTIALRNFNTFNTMAIKKVK